MTLQPPIAPDTKDWTWVLTRPCPECGFDATELGREDIGPGLLRAAEALNAALALPTSTQRPQPDVWSPLEYACHVRDAYRVFAGRLHRMLTEDAPAFENWDQDATALEGDYGAQDPAVVARQLRAEALTLAGAWSAVPADAWERTGTRSDGAVFTVLTLGRYLVHDPVHHVFDATGEPQGPHTSS
jgi:hypothetical protein